MKRELTIFFTLVPLAIVLVPILAHAVTISPAIPGINSNAAGAPPGTWISNFYQFALLISGILAFGAIVYGGVLHAISAGNPGKQSEGKQWIWSALWGILLLGGAYIILNTINPNLLNLNLPALTPINISSGVQGAQCTAPSIACSNGKICCLPGQTCTTNPTTGDQYCSGNATAVGGTNNSCSNGTLCNGTCCASPKRCLLVDVTTGALACQ